MSLGSAIAFLSGKGGTGKTTLCASLGLALADLGLKVLCIDCDAGLRSLDIPLSMADSGAISFAEVCRGEYPLDRAAKHPERPGLQFLTAPVDAGDVEEAAFCGLIAQAKATFDYVLLDGPAGFGPGFRMLAKNADRILLIATQDPLSIRAAARGAELLELMGTGARLILNCLEPKKLSARRLTVDDLMDETGLGLLGLVPEDADFVPGKHKKGAGAACTRIAKRIQGIPVPISIR